VIVLANVSKSYGSKRALLPTSFTVDAERCLALIGSSGSGKSTLLRLILGLIVPDTGSIAIGGEPMTPKSAQRLRLRVGYVIQDGGLFPHLSAHDNVTLVARIVGRETRDIERRVAELTELVGLSAELLDRYPAELSGGERQRVGLMRALMLDPPVLLLDEPLGALDPLIRAKLQEDLRRIFKDLRKTVLLVTHDIGEAAFLGDEVALLRDGAIVQKGSLRDLALHPKDPFVSEFLHAQRPRWSDAPEAP
jgi:osmoprotectant transport system ATP-binding protein